MFVARWHVGSLRLAYPRSPFWATQPRPLRKPRILPARHVLSFLDACMAHRAAANTSR